MTSQTGILDADGNSAALSALQEFSVVTFTADGDTLLATGEIVWVLTDQATRRPIPIPGEMRAVLGRFEGMDFSAAA